MIILYFGDLKIKNNHIFSLKFFIKFLKNKGCDFYK